MFKKIISVVLVLFCLSASLVVCAAEENILKNPEFEISGKQIGMPDDWRFSSSNFEEGDYSELTDKDKKDGDYSVTVHTGGGEKTPRAVWRQDVFVTPGVTYKFSAYVKANSTSNFGARLRILENNAEVAISKHVTSTNRRWQKIELEYKVPEGTKLLSFKLRWDGTGDVFWDSVSLTGRGHLGAEGMTSEETKVVLNSVATDEVTPIEGNLIDNFSFETVTDGVPEGFKCYGNKWDTGAATVVSNQKRSGNNAVKLEMYEPAEWANSSTVQSYITYDVTDVLEGADYTISAWMLTDTVMGRGAYFSYEFYTSAEAPGSSSWNGSASYGSFEQGMVGAWMEMKHTVTIPEGTKLLRILFRLMDAGTIYFDDVSCTLAGLGARFSMDAENYICYTDAETNTVETVLNAKNYEYAASPVMDYVLKDGDTVLFSQKNEPIVAKSYFTFPVSLLKEAGKDYIVEASLRENGKTVILESKSIPVCRYDRPTRITKEGLYKKEDGTLMMPVMAWHVRASQYKEAAAVGINVVQSDTIQKIVEQLDAAQEAGLMMMATMYASNHRDVTPEAMKAVADVVNKIKDHPALFGYLIEDEPAARTAIDIAESMRLRYKTIRDIDPHHPTLIVEQKKDKYGWASKYCDMFIYDDYLLGVRDLSTFKNSMRRAVLETYGEKPCIGLMQCKTISAEYEPKIHELRHMAWQSVWAEGSGIGYYSIYEGDSFDATKTALWSEMKAFYSSGEMDMMRDVFVANKYTTITENVDGDVWYKVWTDGKELYLLVMNMTSETASATIAIDGTGTVSGTLLYGDGAESMVSGTDGVSVSLEGDRVCVYRLTASAMPDVGSFSKMEFADTGAYPWAQDAIEKMGKNDVVNRSARNTYSPAQNLTRADFAYMLMRALGLSEKATTQFTDVPLGVYYAKAIAEGKALGILKGTGDEKFNPDAAISRQDLMVICARGMRLVKELTEGGTVEFTDAEAIADYAVLDIAAVVRAGIVQGNADGTLNPLGNTTRAEAAVIMDRIVAWSAEP